MARVVLALCVVLATPNVASAQQVFESLGSRALGMAGAFVAVADDPSAAYWNPAGLVMGRPGAVTIEWARFRTGDLAAPPAPGSSRRGSSFTSLGTWPFGLSYARLGQTALVDLPGVGRTTENIQTQQFGLTVLQSIAQGLHAGVTLKYVRGTVATGPFEGLTAEAALNRADDLEGRSSNRFDVDLGLIFDGRVFRLGYVVRNLRRPSFPGSAGTAVRLERQQRIGLAVFPASGLTLAIDLDLDTVDLRDGPRRMIAIGGERQLSPKVVVRGGGRWSLEGLRQSVGSAGVSLMVRPSVWVDGHLTHGRLTSDRGFGVALRAGF